MVEQRINRMPQLHIKLLRIQLIASSANSIALNFKQLYSLDITVYYSTAQYTVNDKKLARLQFGECANKYVWQKTVWLIHRELQAELQV